MASLRATLLPASAVLLAAVLVVSCSPEAQRARDGGRGGDPGNKRLIQAPYVDPKAADTTLWPGRAPTPMARLEAGTMYPPPPPAGSGPEPAAKSPSESEQRTFDKSANNPRRQEDR